MEVLQRRCESCLLGVVGVGMNSRFRIFGVIISIIYTELTSNSGEENRVHFWAFTQMHQRCAKARAEYFIF